MRAPKKRTRRTRVEIERLAGEYYRAGITQAEFARQHGVQPLTVAGWIRRFPKPNASREPASKFVTVTVRARASSAAAVLEMVSPSGMRLRFAADVEPSVIRPFLSLLGPC